MTKAISHNNPRFQLGLTLSGGGAKCMAHIGLLQFLAEHGVEPDVISGTSGGALVGAMYAAGHKPAHILDFFLKTRMFSFQHLSFNKLGIIHTEKMHRYLKPYFPDDSFESLKKPLYVVATDLRQPDMMVFDSGQLIKPLLGSAAFPGMFTPVEWQDALMADGGIVNNFPADLIRDLCHFQIGMHLSPVKPMGEMPFKNTVDLLDRVYDIYSVSKVVEELALPDVVLEPEGIEKYGAFSVKNDELELLFELGYECARSYFENEGKAWFAQVMAAVIKRPDWMKKFNVTAAASYLPETSSA